MRIGVVGAGIFGVAGALELRARGHEVTLIERGRIPDERASSTDVSKTIRRLYGDNATYTDLAERAAPTWRAWQERLGGRFYFQTGQLAIERERDFVPGTRLHDSWHAMRARRADLARLDPAEAAHRYPQFAFRPDDVCLFDSWAGYLASGQAVADLADLARAEGVSVLAETPVRAIDDGADAVRVVIDGRSLPFDRVVVAAGVWLAHLWPPVGRFLRPTRQEMAFFRPRDPATFDLDHMPTWSDAPEVDGWYGHPLRGTGLVKVANDLLGPITEPDDARRLSAAFVEEASAFVARRMPALDHAAVAGGRVCLYENTPDRHFIIDWAPDARRVLIAGGGSGHGFKFGGSIGPVIADALEERANPLGDLFRLAGRLAAWAGTSGER